MSDLFDTKNWLDAYHDPDFWTVMFIVATVAALLGAILFQDRYRRWAATRRERAKWLHWNRPKPRH
jgi:hypothetical protein